MWFFKYLEKRGLNGLSMFMSTETLIWLFSLEDALLSEMNCFHFPAFSFASSMYLHVLFLSFSFLFQARRPVFCSWPCLAQEHRFLFCVLRIGTLFHVSCLAMNLTFSLHVKSSLWRLGGAFCCISSCHRATGAALFLKWFPCLFLEIISSDYFLKLYLFGACFNFAGQLFGPVDFNGRIQIFSKYTIGLYYSCHQ